MGGSKEEAALGVGSGWNWKGRELGRPGMEARARGYFLFQLFQRLFPLFVFLCVYHFLSRFDFLHGFFLAIQKGNYLVLYQPWVFSRTRVF